MQCEVGAGVGEASQEMRLLIKLLGRATDSNKCLSCGGRDPCSGVFLDAGSHLKVARYYVMQDDT